MKWIRRVLLTVQSGYDSVHRLTDRRTKWNQYTPLSTLLKGGVNKVYIMHMYMGTAGFHLQTDYKRSVIKKEHSGITWTKYLWLTMGQNWLPGGCLNIKMFYQYWEPMLKIRPSHNRLIFNMGVHIPGKDCLYTATRPWSWPTFQWSLWSPNWNITIRIFWENSGTSQWELAGFPAGNQNVAYLRQW